MVTNSTASKEAIVLVPKSAPFNTFRFQPRRWDARGLNRIVMPKMQNQNRSFELVVVLIRPKDEACPFPSFLHQLKNNDIDAFDSRSLLQCHATDPPSFSLQRLLELSDRSSHRTTLSPNRRTRVTSPRNLPIISAKQRVHNLCSQYGSNLTNARLFNRCGRCFQS